VAAVAVDAVVDVAGDAVVLAVGGRLGMAVGAGKDGVVGGVGVAGGADSVGSAMTGREPGVIERCTSPRSCRVAGCAGGREAGRNVIRVGGAGVLGLMAGVAVCRRTDVDIVDVARGARRSDMRACQRERRVVVIEYGACPGSGVVAGVAGGGKASRGVIGIRSGLPVCRMAGVAILGDGGVVAVDVALRAGQRSVRTGEGKAYCVVVERRRCPRGSGVTDGAVGREAGTDVVRIGCAGEGGLVAGIAGGGCARVVVVQVALRAGKRGMHPGERIVGIERVVEGSVEPRRGCMAGTAVVGQAQSQMRRVRAGVEHRGMAGETGRWRALVYVVDMAGLAGESGVHPRERKAGNFQMVKGGSEPTVDRVARLAGGGKPGTHVIQNRCLEILLVAGNAGRGQAGVLTRGCALVAGFAVDQGMRADERETVLVVFDRLNGEVPSLYRVAVFAIGAHLPAMDVGMAVCAMLGHLFENQVHVALGAGNLLVHAAQRVAGKVVIELRHGADRLPTCVGMAVLTWDSDRSMRIDHLGPGLIRLRVHRLYLLHQEAGQKRQHSNKSCNPPTITIHL